MADKLSKEARSENMRRIKSKDMKPEMIVRKLVHAMEYRYRLHKKDLPGKPDLVFASRKKSHLRPWLLLASAQRRKLPDNAQAEIQSDLLAAEARAELPKGRAEPRAVKSFRLGRAYSLGV